MTKITPQARPTLSPVNLRSLLVDLGVRAIRTGIAVTGEQITNNEMTYCIQSLKDIIYLFFILYYYNNHIFY